MARLQAKFALLLLAVFALAGPILVFAQGIPRTVGPLTVMVPPGWTSQSTFGPMMLFSPDSTPMQYFKVTFEPAEQTAQDVRERHSMIVGNLSSIIRQGSTPQNGVTGKFIWTRMELQLPTGQNETMIVYSAKAGATYVAVGVETTSPNLLARHLRTVEAMLANATLSGATTAPGAANALAASGNTSGSTPSAVGLSTLDEYVFTPPAGWATQRLSDAIMLASPLSSTNEKCLIYLMPMRAAGADLLQDANNAFRDVWLHNYVLRNQTPAGFAFPESIVHGASGQGWEYVIVRRGIAPPNSQESRLAFVMVAKLDNRVAVISGLSKDPLVSACMGENLATTVWPKFFYSLSFKGWPQTDHTQQMRKLLAGEWIAATATAGDLITFAGNGRFANAAAAQQYHLTPNELITTTQAYFGNGSYTLRGNAITMTQDDKKIIPGFFRVEQETKDGSTWADVFYLMRTSSVDGQEYELRFKRNR
ncbi:MAG TPA: hypothetical protein VFP71_01850 [Candidatus Angelobacter sp.]|nr:hypothetical protein [Candidatus Angelobacter sp.]